MKKICTIIVALIINTTINAQQVMLIPTDDMTIYETGCAPGNPPDDKLWLSDFNPAGCHNKVLMKFDLSAYAGDTATNAILKLYHFWHNPHNAAVPSELYAVTETWEESSWVFSDIVTYNTSSYVSPNIEHTTVDNWVEIDITTLVNEWLAGTTTNEGFIIIPNSETKLASFHSKDHSEASEHPHLLLTGVDTSGIVPIDTLGTDTTNIALVKELNNFNIYPNPTKDKLFIDLNNISTQKINISITNTTGKEIIRIKNKYYKHNQAVEVSRIENLSKGMYFINIETNEGVLKKKFIKK